MKKSLSLFLIIVIVVNAYCSSSFNNLSSMNLLTQEILGVVKSKKDSEDKSFDVLKSKHEIPDEVDLYPEIKLDYLEEATKELTPNEISNNSKEKLYKRLKVKDLDDYNKNKGLAKRVVPDSAVLKNSPNLHYIYGKYKPSGKMWYFHKKIQGGWGGFYPQFFVHTNIVLPTKMKELSITFQFTIYQWHYNQNQPNSGWFGWIAELYFDNEVISRQFFQISIMHPNYHSASSVTLDGSIFNVPAGNHEAKIKIFTLNNNYIAFYGTISNLNGYYANEIAMMGYPSTD